MSSPWDSKEELEKMQQEALKRALEMQSQAKINSSNKNLQNQKLKLKKREDISPLIENDRDLILMIAFLLIDEDVDIGLILSLLYLIT